MTGSTTDDVRWLTEEEQVAWRTYLESGRLLFERLEQELQRDQQIPHAYYELLVRLSEAEDRTLRMSDLADSNRVSRSRLSHAVTRLEERGWIERFACDTDRRGTNARLTDVGYAALVAAAPTHVTGVREHLFDQLTPEQVTQLRDISQAVLDHLTGTENTEARSC